MRIVVTCGFNKSLRTVALIHRLTEAGHEVALCLSVRAVSWGRVRPYLRRLGWRKMLRTIRTEVLRLGVGSGADVPQLAPMLKYLEGHDIPSRTVRRACREVGARYVMVKTLSSPEAVEQSRRAAPDLIVYGGGGILRPALIEIPRLGVLNPHPGALPPFRGMNPVEWGFLYGVRPAVTVHYMDKGIDTGPILLRKPVPLPDHAWKHITSGREEQALPTAIEAVLEAVAGVAAGSLQPTRQSPEAGRQFFVIAEPLVEVIQRWLEAGRTPVMDPEDFSFPLPTDKAALGRGK